MLKKLGLVVLSTVFLMTGCGLVDETQTSSVEANVIGPATLASSSSQYTYATPITITWSGMTTNSNDWVAIAPSGSAASSVTSWVYTAGAASGTTQFQGPPGGTYVVRGFEADSYTLEGESDPFTVQSPSDSMATLSADQTTYGLADPITITWSGLPGNAEDWIAIAPQGWPVDDQADWQYTGGGTSGTTVFSDGLAPTGYPGGSYVARAYLHDTFTMVGESAPFVIGSNVTTNKSTYVPFEPITVTWTNLPGNAQDWIALATSGSGNTDVLRWVYTGGVANGSYTFPNGLPNTGSYVARAFENDTYVLLGQSPVFTVAQPTALTITTDASTYALGAPVTVSWTNFPATALDWISIAPVGSSDTTTTRWAYTGGAANGSQVFGGLAPGTYEARGYANDSYTRIGTSTMFVVTP